MTKESSYRRPTEEIEMTEVKEKTEESAKSKKQGQHRSNAYRMRSQRTEGARNV